MGYKHGETGLTVLFGKETTPGIEAGSILNQLGLVQNITGVEFGYEEKTTTSITSQEVLHSKSVRGKTEFTVEFIVTNLMFLFMLFGGYVATYPLGTSPYTHRLKQVNRLQSYSFELINDDLGISRKALGVKANEMKMTIVEGEEIKVTISFVGMLSASEPSPQVSVESTQAPFMYDEITLFTMNTIEKVDVTIDLTWTYTRNVEAKHSIGSKLPRFVKEGKREHLLESEMYQDDNELWDLVHSFTEFPLSFKGVRDAGNDEFTITFPKCKTHLPEQDLPGDDVLMEKATIRPYQQGGADLLICEIIDAIPNYDI